MKQLDCFIDFDYDNPPSADQGSDELKVFCRLVRSRSAENRRVMRALRRLKAAGQMVSLLRQELDSLIRVVYLLNQDLPRRQMLLSLLASGQRWRRDSSNSPVTDKEMVEISNQLEGYCGIAYRFGCAFVHLSIMHDYTDRDPLLNLAQQDREEVLSYCRAYHQGPSGSTFPDLVPYLPKIFNKVSSNLGYYIRALELGLSTKNVI